MVIGFLGHALENLPEGLSIRQLRECLKYRAKRASYLEKISKGGDRFNFDGSLADAITTDKDPKSLYCLIRFKKRLKEGQSIRLDETLKHNIS